MQCCRQLIKSGAPISVTVGDWQHNINYYVNIVAGKRYLYLLCQGECDEKYLEVLDYSGHSIVKYKFDVVPELFDVDEQNGILYGYNGKFRGLFVEIYLGLKENMDNYIFLVYNGGALKQNIPSLFVEILWMLSCALS